MPATSHTKMNLLSFSSKIKTLHLTWFAFFISFFVWFNHAPLISSIRDSLGLSDQEVKALLILNVALTIPARIIIGMLVDRYGPRLTYSLLLVVSGVLCCLFALATDFQTIALTRFLLGFVGAGFVIGIRMIGEWFPARQVGLAEGIYGGWGNFGSAGAAICLPAAALYFGGEEGWRWATATTGIIAILYAAVYYINVRDTPEGATYFKPNKVGAMEITSKGDMILYITMKAPLLLALGILAWKLGPDNLKLLNALSTNVTYAVLAALYFYQVWHIVKINKAVLSQEVPEIHRYAFKQVAVLNLTYLATFGSELAVISMLPLFFLDIFELSPVTAGLLASGFAFTNILARPSGGLLSDKFGRRKILITALVGLSCGYMLMSQITAEWSLALVALITMCCSCFVQAGSGAVFAMVPLIKRRMTGQIAGMVGAYGNVGAVLFLTVLSFVDPRVFFMIMSATAVVVMITAMVLLDEPKGKIAEIMPDGSVELIDVG